MQETYRWIRMWGIQGDPGDFRVGDTVTIAKADGTTQHGTVTLTWPYETKSGAAKLRGFVDTGDE